MNTLKLKQSALVLIFLLLAGCVDQNKIKTIRAMANYLDSRGTFTCLDPELAPPAKLPAHVLYAGYIVGNATSPASTSIAEFTKTMDEISGQGNGVAISYLPQEILPSSVNPDELLVAKILAAKARGFKVVIEIPILFFDFNFTKMVFDVKSLSPNYRSNWNHFKKVIDPYLDSIVGFYPFDEPYWNAYRASVPASDMKEFLDEIAVTIKADLPSIPLVFIEAHPMINADLQIPKGWDWIGMDCYGSFDKCGNEGSQHSIPEYYNILKSKMTASQKLVVVPEAFLFTETPKLPEEIELVRRSKQFLEWIESEPRIVAIVPFIYRNLAEEHISGAREMCPVKEFYQSYLKTARTQLLTTPSLTITCPTTLAAGSSGTCTAVTVGSIVSGHWTVDGEKTANSDNLLSFTWNNIAAGTYKVQGVAKDNAGNTVLSNTVAVTVLGKPTLTITCPTSLTSGSSGTCSSNSSEVLASRYWTVDGVKTANSDNLTAFTWSNIAAGTYKVQSVAKDKAGNSILSNIVSVTVLNKATLAITCPSTLAAGSSGTCTAKTTGTLASGYWTVNGVKTANSDNLLSFTWANVPAGNYKVQGVAKDNSGSTVLSNIVNVTVQSKPTLTISCPTSLRAGSSGTCTAVYTGSVVSGYWTVNGVKTVNSDNLTSFTWNNIGAGTYKVQGVAKDNAGNTILSNIITVNVL